MELPRGRPRASTSATARGCGSTTTRVLRRGLTLSLLQTLESGVPYGGGGRDTRQPVTSGVNAAPFVTNPGYLTPPRRHADRLLLHGARRVPHRRRRSAPTSPPTTRYRIPGRTRAQLFGQLQVLNLFDQFQLCACGGTVFGTGSAANAGGVNIQRASNTTVLTPVTTPARFAAFNPFTTTPVQGVNWD